MTTPGRTERSPHGDVPYLPPSQPVGGSVGTTTADPAPFLPAAQPVVSEPAPEPEFDAAAMVASQKHYTPDPSYGDMPKGTEEGREAARKLREKANRKKRRAKVMGRLVMLAVLAALGVGGYFVYQAVQDSEDDETATPSEASDDATADDSASADEEAPAGASPLGVVEEGVQAQDALNSGAGASAGGFLGAIDDAREVVGDISGEAVDAPADGPAPVAVPIVESDVLPFVLESVSTRLSDQDGFELYVIDGDAFEAANVGAFNRFIEVAVSQPQGESDAFAVFAPLADSEIGLAVQRVDGALSRIVIVTADWSLAVDVVL